MERLTAGETPRPDPFARERGVIFVLLGVLAITAWIALVAFQPGAGQTAMMGLTMGLTAPLFLAIWVVMMVAMMFPTAAPMILTFARVSASKREQGQAFVSTWVFVGAYLFLWTLFGTLAYGAALGINFLAEQSGWLQDNAARIGGIVLVVAGIYQLTPLKRACLTKCRTPIAFILISWRDGSGGAFRMGLEHGLYCLGCCWLLFVILFPLGLMNVAVMALVTLVIFAEKSLPIGVRVGQLAAIALIVYGVLVTSMPQLLPTAM